MQKNDKQHLKYQIKHYATPVLRNQILKELSIDLSTYYRKVNTKIGEPGGFYGCQMLIIASILNRELHELLTDEAVKFYAHKKIA